MSKVRPNPEARVLGGVLVKGGIERTVTINLVALRGLQCSEEKGDEVVANLPTVIGVDCCHG